MTAIIAFLFATWVFWPIEILFLYLMWWFVHDLAERDRKHSVSPGAFTWLIIGALFWWWRSGVQFDWYLCLKWVGVYVALGGVYTLVHYLRILSIFRYKAPNLIQAFTGRKLDVFQISDGIQSELELPNCSVKYENKGNYFYLDWRAFSTALWWTWWPLFCLSFVFESIQDIIEWLNESLKTVFTALSKAFRVTPTVIPKGADKGEDS
jgi:hypothetical protein